MNRFILLLLLLLSAEISANPFYKKLEPKQSQELLKRAWQESYQGNFEQSRNLLHDAVEQKNLMACLFLADGYAKGNVILPQDAEKADYFMRKADELKKERKQHFIEEAKKSPFDFDRNNSEEKGELEVAYNIRSIERGIAKKIANTQAALYARENPWYRELAQVLHKASDVKFPHSLRSKKINTNKLPRFDQAICDLIDLYVQDQTDDHVPLLTHAMQELNIQEGYNHALQLLNDRAARIHTQKRKILLSLVHNWALLHDKQKELAQAYAYFISDCEWIVEESHVTEERKQADLILRETYPLFYHLDPEMTAARLKSRLKRIMREVRPEANMEGLLRYLTLAHQLCPSLFDEIVQENLHKNLENLITLALLEPEQMRVFEGSILSTSSLIECAFEEALRGNGKPLFSIFLRHGQAFYGQYAERVLQIIPIFLQQHQGAGFSNIIELLESPIPSLRLVAFQALINYFCAPGHNVFGRFALDDLFASDLTQLVGNGSVVDAYRFIYDTCKRNNGFYAMQKLWLHLLEKGKSEEKQLLIQMIVDFFGIPGEELQQSHDFNYLLNQGCDYALRAGSLSRSELREFFMQANETGLSKLLDDSFKSKIKGEAIQDNSTPLKQRCQFLSDLLLQHLRKGEGYADLVTHIESLEASSYKDYARALFAIVAPASSYYDYFARRRLLKQFAWINPEFDGKPDVVRALSLDHYNAHQKYIVEDQVNKVHISLDTSLRNVQYSQGLVFGYVDHDQDGKRHEEHAYRLYACDPETGDALWAVPFTSKECLPYVVCQNNVYCMTDDKRSIRIINKQNGELTATISPQVDEEITFMGVSENDILFTCHETKILIADLKTKTGKVILRPEKTARTPYVVGNRLIFCHYNAHENELKVDGLVIVDQYGHEKRVMFDQAFYYGVHVCGNDQILFYSGDISDTSGSFIGAIDCTTGKRWQQLVDAKIVGKPLISKSGDKVFILTDYELIAFTTEQELQRENRVLWQTSVKSSESFSTINDFVISDDEKTIYGINSNNMAPIERFDAQNGTRETLYKITGGRMTDLLGIYNNKVIVRP